MEPFSWPPPEYKRRLLRDFGWVQAQKDGKEVWFYGDDEPVTLEDAWESLMDYYGSEMMEG